MVRHHFSNSFQKTRYSENKTWGSVFTFKVQIWSLTISALAVGAWCWMINDPPTAIQIGFPLLISGPVATFPKYSLKYLLSGIVLGFLLTIKVDDIMFFFEGTNHKTADRIFALLNYQYFLVSLFAGLVIAGFRLLIFSLKTSLKTKGSNEP